jgi:hypothetical protein
MVLQEQLLCPLLNQEQISREDSQTQVDGIFFIDIDVGCLTAGSAGEQRRILSHYVESICRPHKAMSAELPLSLRKNYCRSV